MTNGQDNAGPDSRSATEPHVVPGLEQNSASIEQTRLLGICLLALGAMLAYIFLTLWPSGLAVAGSGEKMLPTCFLGTYQCTAISVDVRLLMIVMVAGALGSFIHTATSFGDFVGNNKLSTNWLWWYILRPFIGTALAAIFYLVIRGGFMSPGTDASSINLYGIVALAGLVGMFSKQATDKLGEVFTTMFKTSPGAGDAKRKDALANPVPTLTNIEPAHFATAAEDGNVVLTGSGFVTGSVTLINGSNRETKFKDSKTLTATLLPADLAHEGELNISVVNPPPGGGTSAPLKIRVGEAVAAVLAPGSTVPQGGDDSGDGNGSDGCDVEITSVTEDKDLPEARGGVAI